MALIRRSRPGLAAPTDGVGSSAVNGRASPARIMLIRNRPGRGSTKASTDRSSRSGSGRS
jgi:hypothetical protein